MQQSTSSIDAAITWLGHSCVQLRLPDARTILVDPWLSENPACPAEFKKPYRCDFVVLTHGHSDHVGDVPELVATHNPRIVGNYDLCSVLEKQIGKGRFEGMNTGGTVTIDGIRFSLTQAFHSSGVESPNGPVYGGMPNGVIISVDGLATVYHAGDTAVFGDMELIAQLYHPKVCMLPIGDRFTMGARGAALAVEMLQPSAILPIHYKTFPILAQSAGEFIAALPERFKKCVFAVDAGTLLHWTSDGIMR